MKDKYLIAVGIVLIYNDIIHSEYTVTKVTSKYVTFHTGASYPLWKVSDWLHCGKLKIKQDAPCINPITKSDSKV
jgi:hypothetical protein